jgi:hypothetical protein
MIAKGDFYDRMRNMTGHEWGSHGILFAVKGHTLRFSDEVVAKSWQT